MDATSTIKVSAQIQEVVTSGSAQSLVPAKPVPLTGTLSVKNRASPIVWTLDAGETKALDLTALDIAVPAFLWVECLTVGKAFSMSLNGAATGVTYTAPSGTEKAFAISTANFTALSVTNPDLLVPISIGFQIFEKA